MTNPWLSVVVPVYNGASTLGRTLASLPQGKSGIEVILVDQSSTDDSLAIAAAYQERLDLHVLPAQGTKNWIQNTNIGIAAAKSPLISMLHQDDLWSAHRAEQMHAFIEHHPDARLWTHDTWFIDADDRKLGRYVPPFASQGPMVAGETALERLLVQNTLAVPSVVFRRSDVLSGGGLDETLWYTADWDLWLRLARMGDIAYLPQPLACFRLHTSSQTVTGSRNLDDFRRQIEIPIERHIAALPAAKRRAVQLRANAAVEMNLCLAQTYHRQPSRWGRLAMLLFRLGPVQLVRLMRDTRIVARTLPRLRLLTRRGKETG